MFCMKKMLYATSLYYPSRYANRLQVLQTAEALAKRLGDDFVLGCNKIAEFGDLYTHRFINFLTARSPILALRQMRYARANGITVMYSREYSILFMMFLYNKVFRLPLTFVLEVHEAHTDYRFTFMIRRCAHIFCLTHGLADDLRAAFDINAPITVLPDGVDIKAFAVTTDRTILRAKFGLPSNHHIVSYVGSVGTYAWKGVDVFLESLSHVKDPSIHYVVAGVKDGDFDEFRTTYAGLPVTFFGWMDRTEVAEIMHLSDALVLPNKRGDVVSEKHTSPLKLFEYMASGTPIIASDLPSTREILDDQSAFLVEPNNSAALAHAVDVICSSPEEAAQRASIARNIVEKYSWDARSKIIIDALSHLV